MPRANLVDGSGPVYHGIYPAIVTDLVDKESLGRIEVRFPWLGTDGDRDVRAWATLCTPYADDNQGLIIVPEVNSQVLVMFEAGNLRRPYVVGSAWNGKEKLPHRPDAANNIRLLRTRAGSRLEFDDTAGAAKITVSTSKGHRVVLDEGGMQITVQHVNGSVIRLTAAGSIEIQANVSVEVKAPMVNVTAPISTFTGVVKCQSVVAEAFVVSPAYTPGVGNLL
ncbi:phage baseplate assembly protein V [Jatrophihabitans sp.]|jgi:uncharacterized protein involved in type VI secretion and phage assembly|uniref:phage baseplate assembly protein V n=1 Tax=Jatrophihabitans sp. TaxID=1932789 RepID=UPI002F1E17F1